MNPRTNLVEVLSKSELFRDYEKAYNQTTNLPIVFEPADSWQLPLHHRHMENPFCALMAGKSKACAACLQMQTKLRQKAAHGPATVVCEYGLTEVAVPVRVGQETIGFLQSGQVRQTAPTDKEVEAVVQKAQARGVDVSAETIREAYLKTEIVSPKKLSSLLSLLDIFSDHLAVRSNQLAMQQANAELPLITRAKEFIEAHAGEELSLKQVSAAVHSSPFYFCKLFKKTTGLNFTEWVSRTRTEKAKNLLGKPHLRISEIAYEVGFQSLTHFNRVFKKIVGHSPTDYRNDIAQA